MSNLLDMFHYVGYSLSRAILYLTARPFQRKSKENAKYTLDLLGYLGIKNVSIKGYYYSIHASASDLRRNNKYVYRVLVTLYDDEDINMLSSTYFKNKIRSANKDLDGYYNIDLKLKGNVVQIMYSRK